MTNFLLGLFTGGIASVLLGAGGYGIYFAISSMDGWRGILLGVFSVVALLLGIVMTSTVGQIISTWSRWKGILEGSSDDRK